MRTVFNLLFFDLDYKKSPIPQASLWALKYVNIPLILFWYWFSWQIIDRLRTPEEIETIVYRLPFSLILGVMTITKTFEMFARQRFLEEVLKDLENHFRDA